MDRIRASKHWCIVADSKSPLDVSQVCVHASLNADILSRGATPCAASGYTFQWIWGTICAASTAGPMPVPTHQAPPFPVIVQRELLLPITFCLNSFMIAAASSLGMIVSGNSSSSPSPSPSPPLEGDRLWLGDEELVRGLFFPLTGTVLTTAASDAFPIGRYRASNRRGGRAVCWTQGPAGD